MGEIIGYVILVLYCAFYLYPLIDFASFRFNVRTFVMVIPLILLFLFLPEIPYMSYTSILLFVISILIIHALIKGKLPYDTKRDNLLLGVSPYDFIPFVISKFFVGLTASIITSVLIYFGLGDDSKQQSIDRLTEASASNEWITIAILFVTTCIIAPLTEEYAIRYFLFDYLLKTKMKLSVILSAIISSIVFASLHDSLGGIVHAFVAGLFFTWIYHRFGLKYSIAAHFTFNFISVVTIVLI